MKINKELVKGSIVILILNMLEREPMYGYKLIKEIEQHSGGVFSFKEGTLYPILHSLEAEGLVESFWTEEERTRKRKYYRLVAKGHQYLKEKRTEWVTFRSAVDKILGEGIVWG